MYHSNASVCVCVLLHKPPHKDTLFVLYRLVLDAMKRHSADPTVLGKAVYTLASLAETGMCVCVCVCVCVCSFLPSPPPPTPLHSYSIHSILPSPPPPPSFFLPFLPPPSSPFPSSFLPSFSPPIALSDAGLKANRAYSYVLAALKNHLLDVNIQVGGLQALSHLLKTGWEGRN